MRISFYLVPTNGRHSCGGVAECRAFNDSIQTVVVKGHDPLLFDSRDQEDVLVKDIHFPSLEIELRQFNFRRMAARKDEHFRTGDNHGKTKEINEETTARITGAEKSCQGLLRRIGQTK